MHTIHVRMLNIMRVDKILFSTKALLTVFFFVVVVFDSLPCKVHLRVMYLSCVRTYNYLMLTG